MTSTIVGISGAKRNACAAVSVDGRIRAACEQERLTRVRGVGLGVKQVPREGLDQVLALAERRQEDVTSYVIAESQILLPVDLPAVSIDHHHAHAATAFLTSPFQRAAVLVCDSSSERELSVWTANGATLEDERWSWPHAFATLYSDCAELFRFGRHGHEHRLEALARLGSGERVPTTNW
jgi:predicted NodU family carbamoyl transferase